MAKQAAKQTDDENLITITVGLIPEDTEQKSLTTISPLESHLIALKTEAQTVVITDRASLDRALDLVVRIKKFETGANKTRLDYTKPARELLDRLKAKVDGWINDALTVRTEVENKINAEQIRIQKEQEQKRLERVKILQDSGWVILDGFYVCGAYRIMFDQLETADDNLIALWQQQGQQEQALRAEQLAAEAKRLAEIEAREKAVKDLEAELAEFRAWKAAKTPPVVADIPAPPAIQFGGIGTFDPIMIVSPPEVTVFETQPNGIATPVITPPAFQPTVNNAPAFTTVPNLAYAEIKNADTSQDTETDYLNVISYNQGIDAVITHFLGTPVKYEKQAWVNLWEELKK